MTATQDRPRKSALVISLAVLATLALFSTTSAAGDDADITVVFTADGLGFTATSTKDLSNIIVELCDGSIHKHDGLNGTSFVHTEASAIAGVWVKSGNNGIGGDAPPGAGERFDNPVSCEPPVTTTTTTTTEPPVTTTEPPVTTTEPPVTTTEPPANTTAPPVTTTEPPSPSETPAPEIPVFPSWTALGLGLVGALGGAFAILRRRLP